MSGIATGPEDVANWMMEQLREGKMLYQDDAAWKIKKKFGDAFVYDNASGNLAIGKDVLKAFGKVTGDNVVWSHSERLWRQRKPNDKLGRQQD